VVVPADARREAARTWATGNDDASTAGVGAAFFPTLTAETDALGEADNKLLEVEMPRDGDKEFIIHTRGYRFAIAPATTQPLRASQWVGDATFSGATRFWRPAGAYRAKGGQYDGRTLLMDRLEEYTVYNEPQSEYLVDYSVALPAGIIAVRDTGHTLEFFDVAGVPVLRFNFPSVVGFDGAGRVGTASIKGVRPNSPSRPDRTSWREQRCISEGCWGWKASKRPLWSTPRGSARRV